MLNEYGGFLCLLLRCSQITLSPFLLFERGLTDKFPKPSLPSLKDLHKIRRNKGRVSQGSIRRAFRPDEGKGSSHPRTDYSQITFPGWQSPRMIWRVRCYKFAMIFAALKSILAFVVSLLGGFTFLEFSDRKSWVSIFCLNIDRMSKKIVLENMNRWKPGFGRICLF